MTEKLSACLLLVFGAAMAGISLFLPPEGEIDGSVLMLFAQVLVYAGSIFGVKIYIKDIIRNEEMKKMKNDGDRNNRNTCNTCNTKKREASAGRTEEISDEPRDYY